MTKKRAYYVGFNGICATYCVFRRKSPILKKFLQCIILQPEYCRPYNMYTPPPRIYCNHFCIFMHFLLLAPCADNVPLHQIPRTAGVSRGRVPRTGVITLPYPLRGQRGVAAALFVPDRSGRAGGIMKKYLQSRHMPRANCCFARGAVV